ncbi:MAG: DUF6691 family protein, partial [Chitinophagaceae bacterium]
MSTAASPKVQYTDFEIPASDQHSSLTPATRTPLVYPIGYLVTGLFFGVVLVKAEVISWFRIQEMFRLQSFHMYGVIGSAVITGMISLFIIRKLKISSLRHEPIQIPKKDFHKGVIYGGLLFGFGWALTGACPGPLYALLGNGSTVTGVSLLSAIAGTWCYGK